MAYFKSAVSGVSWIGSLRGFIRIVGFLKIAILARILTPDQFGVFAIATLVLIFLETLTQTGINVYLIQHKRKIDEYVDTAWVISIARGILMFIVLILLSPLIAKFFSSPESRYVIMLISIVPLIKGFINPSIAKIQKDLMFKKDFAIRATLFGIDTVVVIVVAIITKSAASLAIGLMVSAVFEVILSFRLFEPRPKFVYNAKKAKQIIHRGKWVTFAGIFNYGYQNGDDIVVGRVLGSYSLGLYQVAYKISTLPLTEVTQVFGRVNFPIYVKIARDKDRLKKAFKKTLLATVALVLPFGIAIFLFPKLIILIILGENWLEATEVLRVLSIFGVIMAVIYSFNALFLAVKKQEYVMYVSLVAFMGMAIVIIPLVSIYGMVGAAYSAIAGSLLAAPLVIYFYKKIFSH